MNFRNQILCIGALSLIWIGASPSLNAQKNRMDPFREMIRDISIHLPASRSTIYVSPTEADLHEWNTILAQFRFRAIDSCEHLLEKYHYNLLEVIDRPTGNTYDVIREKLPIQRGWGTFIYNRNHSKRLNIHVNHPADDAYALALGVEFFRRSSAEWLFIGGTSKFAGREKYSSDVGTSKRTIFGLLYENLSDLTHVTISFHSFSEKSYVEPISSTDVIISNGKTSDDQWGISQISLAFRDTMRVAGFASALAMYDSGYARLAGGWNVQGLFSNDSLGFGHWMYLECSHRILSQPREREKLVSTFERAVSLTGKRISQQVNRAFGLVSPRIVRVDSLHRMMFPAIGSETYRIVSFNTDHSQTDTLDIRMGNWLELLGGQKSVTTVTKFDSSDGLDHQLPKGRRRGARSVVAQLVTTDREGLSSTVRFSELGEQDTSRAGDDQEPTREPLQVHRIPLQPVLASTFSSHSSGEMASYRWSGVIPAHFVPGIKSFQMNSFEATSDELQGLPKYLIPLISSSYRNGRSKFIGVEMTNVLVKEIARLVSQHAAGKDVGLIAEQSESGSYYLRIFPASSREKGFHGQP